MLEVLPVVRSHDLDAAVGEFIAIYIEIELPKRSILTCKGSYYLSASSKVSSSRLLGVVDVTFRSTRCPSKFMIELYCCAMIVEIAILI